MQVLERKLNRNFELLDLDRDGFIEEKDIKAFTDKICSAASITSTSPQGQAFRKQGEQLWQTLQKALDKNRDESVSREEFMSAADRGDVMNQAIQLGASSFGITDTDGDDRMHLEEWVRMDQALGVNRTDSEKGFRQLDQDGDGYVTKEEYVRAVEEFYRSSDAAASGNWAFGKF